MMFCIARLVTAWRSGHWPTSSARTVEPPHVRYARACRALYFVAWAVIALPVSNVAGSPPARDYDRLVQQLGSASFRVRDHATRALERAGLTARGALLQGLKSPDLEVRMRAHRLLTQILKQDFDRKLADFLNNDDSKVAAELPAWDRFSRWMGHDRKTREFFVSMLRRELPLLDTLARNTHAGAVEQAAVRRLQELAEARLPNGMREEITPTSIAALLFVLAQPELKIDTLTESRVYSLLVYSTTKQRILAGPRSEVLKKLLEKWIVHVGQDHKSYYAIRLALAFQLKQLGARLGRETLQDSETSPSMLPYAGIALARFGRRDDARFLLPHLENRTVCHTWSNPQLKKNEPIRIEVRDVMLAMLVHMSGQDPKDYGFKLLAPDPDTIYRIYTFGFLSEEERDKAFHQWKTWYAAHGQSLDATKKTNDKAVAKK